MSTSHAETKARHSTRTFPISADESAREIALRRSFADFWGTAQGPPRTIYDTFIAACPIAEDVSVVSVNDRGVEGWWLRPTSEGQERAILFLHGGSYVQGSAKAYRGLASRTPRSRVVHRLPARAGGRVPSRPGSGDEGMEVAFIDGNQEDRRACTMFFSSTWRISKAVASRSIAPRHS